MNEPTAPHRIARLLLFGYLGFLVYASLYPISGFRPPDGSPFALIFGKPTLSRTDALANLLFYIPLGWLLGARGLSFRQAGLAGCALSFVIEALQAYLPGRVPSFLDWGLNSAGTVLGAALAPHFRRGRWPELEWILGVKPRARLGLAAFGTWVGSQLFPFIPSVDVGSLRAGLRPLWHVLRGQASFSFAQTISYALATLALSLVLKDCLRPNPRYRALVPAAFLAVLAAKVPIIGQQLSLEALVGGLAGLVFSWRRDDSESDTLSFFAAAGAFVVEELRSGGGGGPSGLRPFNWIPLKSSIANELIGATDILATAWPFLAMAFVVSGWRKGVSRQVVLGGAVLVFGAVMALEWAQTRLPGRAPDITDAFVATGAWLVSWLLVSGSGYASGPTPAPEGRYPSGAPPPPLPRRPEPR